MEYEIVIGLEIHAELKTRTKMFCNCRNEFGAKPNTLVCPVCLAMPGALPAMNRTAVEYAIRAGLAMNCSISSFTKMDRKTISILIFPGHIKYHNTTGPCAMTVMWT